MKFMLKSVFMAIESTYGAGATPGVGDVILVENVDINPINMETDNYAPVSNRFGRLDRIVGHTWCTLAFDVVVCGGGTPLGNVSSLPNHDVVLRAAAMARTINAGTDITYQDVDTGEESAAISYQIDGSRYIVRGIRGDIEWIFEQGKAVRLRFNGLGLRAPMTDTPLASYGLPVRPRPLAMTAGNVSLSLSSFPLRCSQLNVKLGNKLEYLNRSNQEEIAITDRESSGSITFELPSVAAKNFIGDGGVCTIGELQTLNIQLGNTAGNRVSWGFGDIQLLNPKIVGDKGKTMLRCDLHFVRNVVFLAYF